MTLRSAACVVFDVDDTLYLERDYVRSGFKAVDRLLLQQLGLTGFEPIAWSLFEGGLRGNIFDEALRRLDREPDRGLIADMVGHYRNHEPAIRLLRDASACLGQLSGRYRLAALTGGPPESQRRKVAALGLDNLVRHVVLSGECGPAFDKPHVRAFELMEHETKTPGERCVYVADNPAKDFAGPKSREWRTVRVRREGALHVFADSGPDVDLEEQDLTRLGTILDAWFGVD
jgi:putative hydrolase of the HAD superfamily